MLDSLGSTLSHQTINSFFTRFGKQPQEDALTYAEAIQCLETEVCRPTSEKRRLAPDEKGGIGMDTSASGTPNVTTPGAELALNLDKLDFSGPAGNLREPNHEQHESMRKPDAPAAAGQTEGMQKALPVRRQVRASSAERGLSKGAGAGGLMTHEPEEIVLNEERLAPDSLLRPPIQSVPGAGGPPGLEASASSSDAEEDWSGSGSGSGSGSNGDSPSPDNFERVINVKNCPLCHRPRLNSKAEKDIVTHLAVCASQDWARVDRIMVGNFVTASQAQRKWYTKIFSKMSSGDYRLGAVRVSLLWSWGWVGF